MSFLLTRSAESDLLDIYLRGEEQFGDAAASGYIEELYSIFEIIATHPELARVRDELRQPVRGHPHRSHIIFYALHEDGNVLILRVRHAHEDWMSEDDVFDR